MQEKIVPISEGEVVTVQIVSKGVKGDGIAKVKGFTIIVLGAHIIGDTVQARITRVKDRFAFAEMTD